MTLPRDLPRAMASSEVKAAFPRQAGFRGLSPVAYVDGGQEYEHLRPGTSDAAVEYGGVIYLLESPDQVCILAGTSYNHQSRATMGGRGWCSVPYSFAVWVVEQQEVIALSPAMLTVCRCIG